MPSTPHEILVTPVQTRKELKEFLRFPWKVQAADPNWVPPLLIDIKSRFSPKYPFYEHGEVTSFLARHAGTGEPLGRISAIVNRLHNEFHHDSVGFFGLFESVDDVNVARALFDHAGEFLKQRGLTVMRGPANFSSNDEWGMLIEGYDTPPPIMMLHNPPYYNTLVEACGFVKGKDIYGWQLHKGTISERVMNVGERLENRLKIRIRPFNPKEFWKEVDRILEIYNQSWDANWGFVPMTPRELKLMAETLRLVYDKRLIFFAETPDGKPVGFSLALPDMHVIFKKMNGRLLPTGIFKLLLGKKKIHRARVLLMGVIPEFRGRGLDSVMARRTYVEGVKAGYDWAEFSWTLEDNRLINDAMMNLGAQLYKKWRLWDKTL